MPPTTAVPPTTVAPVTTEVPAPPAPVVEAPAPAAASAVERSVAETQPEEHKVLICHRTNAVTHPYANAKQEVDDSSVDGVEPPGNDHQHHGGPAFDPNAPYPPPHNGDQWGDIIPPFYADGSPGYWAPLNWDAAGQAIFNNGCVPPTPPPPPVGSLAVEKVVAGDGTPDADVEFTVEVDCDGDEFDTTLVFDETGALVFGDLPITDIPVGTECTVTETGDGGAGDVSYDPADGTVTIEEDETVTVTVTNTFDQAVGSIDVSKVVAGSGTPDPGATFTVEVDCDDDAFDETLVFDSTGALISGTTPQSGIPVGVQCTVTETGDGGADGVTYSPNGGTPTDPPTVTIGDYTTVKVKVTNTFDQAVGSIDVSKLVAGDEDPDPGATFTVEVDCDDDAFDETLVFDATGALISGTSLQSNVPVGTQCTVTETGDGGADGVSYSPNGGTPADAPTVTITESVTVTVTVTNTFSGDPRTPAGAIDVSKVVAGSGTPDPAATFTIEVDCENDNFDETLVFDATGTLISGTSLQTDLPVGMQCTVTETGTGGADTVAYFPDGGSPADPPTVTIRDLVTVTVTVTNTFDQVTPAGALDVSKVIAAGAPAEPGSTFTVSVDCDDDSFDRDLTFDETGALIAGTAPILNMPVGTECTVTETDDGGASGVLYSPDGGTPTDPPTVTIVDAVTVTVTVTNSFLDAGPVDPVDPPEPGPGDPENPPDGGGPSTPTPPTGSLARTGADLGWAVPVSVWLLAIGSLLVLVRRRLTST